MVHEQFDLELWKSRFPLQKLIDADKFGRWKNTRADYVTAPGELALELQIRDAVQADRGPFSKIPTDAFVFGEGEPTKPFLTKIGGNPYLPQILDWPTTSKGEPMSFVGQLCFLDSLELVGKIPGDILLIFGRMMATREAQILYWEPEDNDSFKFIWVNTSDNMKLRSNPDNTWIFNPYYAAIHRDIDLLDPDPFSKNERGDSVLFPSILPTTKIGGKPFWAQDEANLPGRFIAMISDLKFQTNIPYPLLNREEPLLYLPYGSPEHRKIMGLESYLYLFLDEDTIHWTAQGS